MFKWLKYCGNPNVKYVILYLKFSFRFCIKCFENSKDLGDLADMNPLLTNTIVHRISIE